MKTFDFRKEYKNLYAPATKPILIDVPEMRFIMVDGEKDPNNNPSFSDGVELLYGLSYAIKMSKMKGLQPEGYYDFVVAPLEGLWWVDEGKFSFTERTNWKWTIMIRQPEFVTQEAFEQACLTLKKKKPGSRIERARLENFTEGLCVQMMHVGPYATEPETVAQMDAFTSQNKLLDVMGRERKHHEIYLSDPKKVDEQKMKTILRHPVALNP